MKKKFIIVVFVMVANILLCSCVNNKENFSSISQEPTTVITEEDKELSRTTVESFMNELCEFDMVNVMKYVVDGQEVSVDLTVDINELKQGMLESVKGTVLDDYRMYDLVDKLFEQFTYEILNFYEVDSKYIYDVWVKMPDMNRITQEIPNAFNDDVIEKVIAECLYKGVLTEADLYSENFSDDKLKAFENVAVDKIMEKLNEMVDKSVLETRIKLTLIKQNSIWLVDLKLSDIDSYIKMFE